MSDAVYVGKQARRVTSSPQFHGFSRVVLTVDENIEYIAGSDIGRTLTLTCPFGTQQIAEDILESIRGYQYQPYKAEQAFLDPAAELGDAITVGGIYSGIYSQEITFGSPYLSTVSAPEDEEVDQEFPYVPKQQRLVERKLANMTADLKIQAGLISAEVKERTKNMEELSGKLAVQAQEISAKVSSTGGDVSSFGWSLKSTEWTVSANGQVILRATKGGLEVTGKITATSGKIGGFDILSDHLSYNNQTWKGTNTYGAYLGISGLQLGKNFRVDMSGNLYASSGTFSGSVYAGSIQHGGSYGTLDGSGITYQTISGNRLEQHTITTTYTNDGINKGVAGGVFATDVFNGYEKAEYIKTKALVVGSTQFTKQTITFKDYYGNTRTITGLFEAAE